MLYETSRPQSTPCKASNITNLNLHSDSMPCSWQYCLFNRLTVLCIWFKESKHTHRSHFVFCAVFYNLYLSWTMQTLLTFTMVQSSSGLVGSVLTYEISRIDETDRQMAQRMVLRRLPLWTRIISMQLVQKEWPQGTTVHCYANTKPVKDWPRSL